jgi:hypothetical protein
VYAEAAQVEIQERGGLRRNLPAASYPRAAPFFFRDWSATALTFTLESTVNNEWSAQNGENTDITAIDTNANVYDVKVKATLQGRPEEPTNVNAVTVDVPFTVTLTKDCSYAAFASSPSLDRTSIDYIIGTDAEFVQYTPPLRTDEFCAIKYKI